MCVASDRWSLKMHEQMSHWWGFSFVGAFLCSGIK
jgi:hypothetical protein